MKIIFLAVSLLATLGAGVVEAQDSGRTVIEREGEPGIINYEGDDPKMEAAIENARSKLPYFWERMASPKRHEDGFTLKVEFPVSSEDGVTAEHIWVDGIVRTAEGFSAKLANEPNWIENKRLGDAVTFTEDMISDWGFGSRGKMIGFYTVRVMLPDMPADQRDMILPMLGRNPE